MRSELLDTVHQCVGWANVYVFRERFFHRLAVHVFLYLCLSLWLTSETLVTSHWLFLSTPTLLTDIINATKNIQWSKVAFDIQVMMNNTVVRTGAFVSDNVWSSDWFKASAISVMFLVAYWSIIYLDSNQPGVNPPSPLSAITRKKLVFIDKLWTS